MNGDAPLIGVDWGNTNLRAYLFSNDGDVAAVLEGPAIAHDHAKGLERFLKPWEGERRSSPILICGMAGARGGWLETAYVSVPAGLAKLAANGTAPRDFQAVTIVPGVSRRCENRFDVMRGEEVQALGSGVRNGLVIAPGTHSKWITLKEGRISDLRTFATGEMYAACLGLGSLASIACGDTFNRDAFILGLKGALSDANLLELIFGLRAEVLLNGFSRDRVATRLSGLLIGTELKAARKVMTPPQRPALVCAPQLADLYCLAFETFGLDAPERLDPVQTTAGGLWAIHLALQRQTPS